MENSIEKKFHDEIIKLCDDNKSSNNSIFTRERYRETIGNVKEAKLSSKKTALQRYFLRQYDVLSVAGIEKLIRKGDEIFYYCTVDELYPLIRTAHSGVGHGGFHKTYKELKKQFANISREIIRIFIQMCEQCILKKSRTETTKLVVRPITSTDFNSRCQVDLVDYQSCPDGEYKWIMHYQDHLTKFSVLRPLKTKRAAEVAYQLTDIFLLLGAPHILQSDNGREFTANIITELKLLWPDLKLVHGRPRHPQSQGSVERANADIKSMMISWTHENNNTHWSEGLRFVQFHKNRSHHRTIDQSPYKALFGSDPKVGLSSSALPKELLDTLETEEDLIALTTATTCTSDDNVRPNIETETDLDTNTETETDLDTHTETETDLDTNTETETDLEINTEMETDMDTNTETDTNLDSNTETDVDTNFKIIRARKRALSGQQIQADEMLSSSKKRLKDLEIGDNVIIPVQRVDRGPMDCKNIKGVVLDIAENGYKVGTTVGIMFGFMSRNQIEKIQRKELTILDIPENTEVNVRKAVQLLSLSGGQGHVHCSCRGGCKTGKCKCKKMNLMCNSRCHASLSCANK